MNIRDAVATLFQYSFSNENLITTALTHRSHADKNNQAHYEQLEFLGDAALGLAVSQLLLQAFPDASEGELSKMRAALVNTSSLAFVAKELHLGDLVRLGPAEETSGGREKSSILADVFEAIIGAIFLEAGFLKAHEVVRNLFIDRIAEVNPSDPKTELQEILHTLGKSPPRYVLEQTEGPEHAPTFVTAVEIEGEIMGRGSGPTKKLSQQVAASMAIERVGRES